MHKLFGKMMNALSADGGESEETDGVNTSKVFGSKIAERISEKGSLLRVISENGPYDTYTAILKRFRRYDLTDDEAEWLLAFVRVYVQVQEQYGKRMQMELMKRDVAQFVKENGGPEGLTGVMGSVSEDGSISIDGTVTAKKSDEDEDEDDATEGLYL